MAVEVNQLLKKDANHNKDISIAKNHICCFYHKLAIILNVGLKASSIPPPKKNSQLGKFWNLYQQ
jgi:hypothetical protein